MFINSCVTPEGKQLMTEFFKMADYLEDNIETITREEFEMKSKEMWGKRAEVMDIEGTYLIIDLFSLGEKADNRFGKDNIESL